jgi:hypothetical protein
MLSRRSALASWSIAALSAAAFAAACGSDGTGGQAGGTTGSGGTTTSGQGGDGNGGGLFQLDAGSDADSGPSLVCEPACTGGLQCVSGVCLPPQPGCASNADCQYDTYCAAGACVPWGAPPEGKTSDPGCKLTIPPEMLVPTIKCEFMTPPTDPAQYPDAMEVRVTPMVVNFEQGPNGPTGSPSIVAPFGFTWGALPAPNTCAYEDCNYRYGVIRVLSGADCSLQAVIGGTDIDPTPNGRREWARSSSPVALADLDGDGVAEIVAYMVEEPEGQEVTVAWTRKNGAWAPLWPTGKATNPDGSVFDASVPVSGTSGADWAGPSIHDLDDDGKPEIIREGWVIDGQTGVVRAAPPTNYASYSVGILPVLAELDGDARIEMTNGAHVWEFDPAGNQWVEETYYSQANPSPAGWVAIADFTPYDGLGTPEIAVVSQGRVTLYDYYHSLALGLDVAVPSGGGGPPTIADYDGDGLPEIGVAGADYYTVYDPDCQANPRPGGKCTSRDQCDHMSGSPCPDLILWSRRSQDHSSRITGSSVFDFEADGKAEVVYADECFARVYSGSDGKVLFSQYRSSSTWLENPVVADVDGDYRSELVVPSNGGASFSAAYCGGLLDAEGVETHFAGLICKTGADCLSGVCDAGLCRCQSSAECCAKADDAACIEFGYKCATPPAGTAGTGNTCRASYPHGLSGIRVYKDSHDRWVRSRTIWSQHAYSVTHIEENGTVPKTSAWKRNWSVPGLDNFRQNVPGVADGKAIGDMTSEVGSYYSCNGLAVEMSVPVCNRGTAPIGAGVPVGFYAGGQQVCQALTSAPLPIGECIQVACTWTSPPSSSASAVDVDVVPNDGGAIEECVSTNNGGRVLGVYCKGIN